MDQRVITTFNAYYLRNTLMEMMKVLDISDKTVKDNWRSFDILKRIKNIKLTWDQVSAKCLNGVWSKLLPTSIHDFEEVAHQENLIEDIIRLVRDMGLEDVTELLEAHGPAILE